MINLLTLKKQNIVLTLVTIQLITYFIYLKTGNHLFLALYFGITIPIVAFNFNNRFNLSSLILLFSTILIFIFFSFQSKEFDFIVGGYNLLYGLSALVGAYALYKNKNSINFIKILYWLYAAFISYYILLFGFSDPSAYNTILEGSSRNYLSAIAILILILLSLNYEYLKQQIPLTYPVLTFFFCIALFGRSGILLSLFLLLFIIVRQKRFKFLISLLITLVVISIYYSTQIYDFVLNNTNFKNFDSSERSIFISEYLRGITYNTSDLFFGRRIQDCCQWIQFFGNNPHNSFIMGHMRYGIIHTILSILILIYIIFSRNFILTIFGLIIFSRFFVDQLGLFTGFDIVLYYLLFIIYYFKKNINNEL